MGPTHTPQIISVKKDGYFMTYFKACGALWHVCYNALHPFGEEGRASKEIDGKLYDVEIQPVHADGRKAEHDKGTEYICFRITTNDGSAEIMARLEEQLIGRLRDIQERDLPYFSPKPADFELKR